MECVMALSLPPSVSAPMQRKALSPQVWASVKRKKNCDGRFHIGKIQMHFLPTRQMRERQRDASSSKRSSVGN